MSEQYQQEIVLIANSHVTTVKKNAKQIDQQNENWKNVNQIKNQKNKFIRSYIWHKNWQIKLFVSFSSFRFETMTRIRNCVKNSFDWSSIEERAKYVNKLLKNDLFLMSNQNVINYDFVCASSIHWLFLIENENV